MSKEEYRGFMFKNWLISRNRFEEAKTKCDIIATSSMVIWLALGIFIIKLIGVPSVLQGTLVGAFIYAYALMLFIGAGAVIVYLVLARIYKLRFLNDRTLKYKRILKDIERKEEEES